MPKKIVITIDGYLKSSHLDKEGAKTIVLEYSANEAIKLAQLELMGRDLNNHLPILLRTTYEISPFSQQKVDKKNPQQRYSIRRQSIDT